MFAVCSNLYSMFFLNLSSSSSTQENKESQSSNGKRSLSFDSKFECGNLRKAIQVKIAKNSLKNYRKLVQINPLIPMCTSGIPSSRLQWYIIYSRLNNLQSTASHVFIPTDFMEMLKKVSFQFLPFCKYKTN